MSPPSLGGRMTTKYPTFSSFTELSAITRRRMKAIFNLHSSSHSLFTGAHNEFICSVNFSTFLPVLKNNRLFGEEPIIGQNQYYLNYRNQFSTLSPSLELRFLNFKILFALRLHHYYSILLKSCQVHFPIIFSLLITSRSSEEN